MVSLLGAVLLIAAAGATGLQFTATLSRKVRELEEIEYALNILAREILYGQTRLPLALEIIGTRVEDPVGLIFTRAAAALAARDITPREAFIQAAAGVDLAAGDAARVLSRLGDELGRTGSREQERFLSLALEDIRLQLSRARRERDSLGRIYAWGGFLLGGMLVLMLL